MAGHPSLVSEEADRSLGELLGVFRAQERKLAQEKADLDKQAEGLARQAEALEQERQQMAAIGIADNDVLELNVGGVQFAAKRATLTQVEGSVLAAMFSGRWEQCLDKDSQGHIFLDFDPHCFDQIVTFLRCRMRDAALGVETPAPVVKASKQHAYALLADYLGLQHVLGGCQATQISTVEQPSYVFNGEVKDAIVDGAWSKIVCCGNGESQVILGPALATGQVHYRKCRIDNLWDKSKQSYGFVGISPCSNWCDEQISGSGMDRTGSYGWCPRADGICKWVNGQAEGRVPFGCAPYRNILLFQIDLVRGRLAYIFMGRQQNMRHAAYKMPLPIQFEQPMFFRVDVNSYAQVRSLSVTEADKKLFDQPDLFV